MIEMRAAVAFSSDDFEENCAILPVCNAFQQKICEGFQFERILSEPLTDVIVEKTAISQMPQSLREFLMHSVVVELKSTVTYLSSQLATAGK
jgi:hypothetical protein